MRRNLSALANKEYDLIVVGGGIFGVCAAWDAALRGLSVAIVEKKDFSHASSANHLRMVHGGIRYLQHGDVYRIRESCRERSELLHIAPHLVNPLPIIVPTYGHGMKGKEFFGMGLFVYDLLTLDRNWSIQDPDRRIPRGHFISSDEILRLFPGLERKGLTGGAVFYDGQMYNPQRLGLSFLKSAVDAGCNAANYLEVAKFIRKANLVSGVEVRDVLTGNQFEIRSRVVLNAAGSWAHRLLEKTSDLRLNPEPTFSRDLAFIVPRRISDNYGFACPLKTKDADSILDRGGRHLFVVPWRGYTLIGVWHVIFHKSQEEIGVTEKELQGFINEVNATQPGFALKLEDVSMILTGLTLFGEEGKTTGLSMSFGKRSRLIDHYKENHCNGLITLLGVRATTARGMAEKAVDLVLKKIGRNGPRSKTSVTPVYGGQIVHFQEFLAEALKHRPLGLNERAMTTLIHNYGSKYREVFKYIEGNPTWGETLGGSTVLKAEIIHALREEMAQCLEDVVFRRTDLGVGMNPGEEILRTCAEIMSKELDWDQHRTQKELEGVQKTFLKLGFLTKESEFRESDIARNVN